VTEGGGASSRSEGASVAESRYDRDALLCALILAPQVFSRNRYFWLFEDPDRRRVRRRAGRVRGIARQLLGEGRSRAEIVAEQILDDGQVLLRYEAAELGYSRSAALSRLEAASLRFVLHRARGDSLDDDDRVLVESALDRLGGALGIPGTDFSGKSPSEQHGQD
jgi:hypothetical protein